jgi:SAM-dependent methyltransferase
MASVQDDISTDPLLRLGVLLQCPRCQAPLSGMECLLCSFGMRTDDGVVHALPPERAAHFARFVHDYELIREAEGRSSESEEFYLGLPYKDLTGRNSGQWHIRSRSYNYLLRRVLHPNLPQGGLILDLGAGNCWMSFRLALAGYLPIAVDLLANGRDGLGAARHYRKILPHLFPRFLAEMKHLPFQDRQFDAVVFNASFHYSEDYVATLCEALRCLKTGGMVIVSDSPWYSRAESGKRMLDERRATFLANYGTPSDSIESLEYLTDERLKYLEASLSIRWRAYAPRYGFKWALRPLMAKLRRKREPSRFRIYVAWKNA